MSLSCETASEERPDHSTSVTQRVLLIGEDPAEVRLIRAALYGSGGAVGLEMTHASTLAAAEAHLRSTRFSAVLLDLSPERPGSAEVVARLLPKVSGAAVVVVSDVEDEQAALASARLGAQDFVVKTKAELQTLQRRVQQAVERNRRLLEERRVHARERNLAARDPLTSLPNREHFREHLSRALSFAQRHDHSLAVLFVDLDGFKPVNDLFGHDVGDEVLARVAERLRSTLRRSDAICRYGGDEFAVCLSKVAGSVGAARAARHILNTLSSIEVVNGSGLRLSASIGVSLFRQVPVSPRGLIRRADQAMYSVKRRGGGDIQLFNSKTAGQDPGGGFLDFELDGALARGELHVHYQAQVDDRTRRVVGAEALVRWLHPKLGLLLPCEFLPAAKESHLITKIGAHVLGEACRASTRWREAGTGEGLKIAVNVSLGELEDPGFVPRVEEVLEQTRADPRQIEFEITETSLSLKGLDAMKTLRRVKDMGFRLAIDGFGTGYSTLSNLKGVPVDTLKINRSFVAQAGSNRREGAIVAGLVDLARRMSIEVIGEGVETEKQRRFLRASACSRMQGFFFGCPEPPEKFEAALLRGAAKPRPSQPEPRRPRRKAVRRSLSSPRHSRVSPFFKESCAGHRADPRLH